MPTMTTRMALLAIALPCTLAYTHVALSAMPPSHAARHSPGRRGAVQCSYFDDHEPCLFNMEMPPRVGGPAQAAQAREARARAQRAPILPIANAATELDLVIAQAAAENRLVVVKIHAKFCRACKLLEPKYQRVANTWAAHNVEFRKISYEDNRQFCQEVLGIRKLPTTKVFLPSRGQVASIMDGSDVGKLEGSLRKLVRVDDADDDYGI